MGEVPALQCSRTVRLALPVLLLLSSLAGASSRVTVASLFAGGRARVHTGSAPSGTNGLDAARCAGCHAEIAAEWRASMHAQSWRDPVFRAAYDVEPMAFCRNCHAPTHTGTTVSGLAADDGVSCAVCHVRAGHVLGAHANRSAPHPVMAVRGFDGSAFCAGCHQFNFPGDSGVAGVHFDTREPMQDTYAEWLDSAAARAGTACQDCHMPWSAGANGTRHRSHRFPGGRDLALLQSAVEVAAEAHVQGGNTVISFTVTPRTLGHSFPTGDLFRRAELTAAWDGDDAGTVRAGLARAFDNVPVRVPGGAMTFVRRQSSDTRIPAAGLGAPVTVTLRLPGTRANTPVRWRFDHLLMPTPLAASQGFGEPRNRLTVFSGTIVPAPSQGASP